MQIVIDIPEQFAFDDTVEGLATRFKLYAGLMMYRSGRLSIGAACDLAGVDRYSFLSACKQHGIPTATYSPEELAEEIEWLGAGASSSS